MGSGLVATGREAGPVVEVDDLNVAFGRDDAVAPVNDNVECVGRAVANLLHMLEFKFDAAALAVDGFVAIFAVSFIKGIKPEKVARTSDAVKFNQVADKVTVDDGAGYAAQKIFLQHLLGLFGMAHIADILLVHGVKVAALNPTGSETGLAELGGHGLIGVDHKTLRIRYIVADEDTCHALAGAVLDAKTRVDNQAALLLIVLQQFDGALFAAHIDYNLLVDAVAVKLILGVNGHLAAAFAQLVDHTVEYRGIVAYMIGRICPGTHNCRYFFVCHLFKFSIVVKT